jgi:hypothetical protein
LDFSNRLSEHIHRSAGLIDHLDDLFVAAATLVGLTIVVEVCLESGDVRLDFLEGGETHSDVLNVLRIVSVHGSVVDWAGLL